MLQRTPKAPDTERITRAVDEIRVGERHRHDLGDIASLARDIAEVGLLHPVVITSDNTLIAGYRRLEAGKLLGWGTVPVTVVNLTSIVRGELSENANRKDFLPSEIDAIRRSLEPIEKAAAKQRQRAGLKRGQKKPVVESFHNGGKTRDKVAAFAGVSGRTVDKIKAVVDAARADPERFGCLVTEMDRTGKVHRVYAELRRVQIDELEALPIDGDRPSAQVVHGDFREQGHVVEDGSVDLVFTDPVYHREAIPLYADLAKFAERVLVEGGSLICYVGHFAIPEVLPLMTPHLTYWWMCSVVHTGGNTTLMGKGVSVGFKPLLWFVKGSRRTKTIVRDCVVSSPGKKTLDHEWAQGEAEARCYIEHLSRKNSLIVDPYCGGGTTGVAAVKLGRKFIGFEIEPATARKAEARIARVCQADKRE